MIAAVLNCTCGRSPRLVRRGDYSWYACSVCSRHGPKALTIPVAAAGWNDRLKDKETP